MIAHVGYNFGCFKCGETTFQKIRMDRVCIECSHCGSENYVVELLLDGIAGLEMDIDRLKETMKQDEN